jgi:DNA-binding MarR family transcriptional regulator
MEDATNLSLSKNQFYILKMLANSSPFNLSDLANILSVSNAAIGKNIDKLVHYKLVTRRFRKRDRRTAKVSITQSGKDIIEKYYKLKIEKQVEIFKQYTLKEKEEFSNYLRSFIGNTLHEDMNTDILCLQCNGFCGDDCVVKEKKGTCLRKH